MTTLKDKIRDLVILYIDERKHRDISIMLVDTELLVDDIIDEIKDYILEIFN